MKKYILKLLIYSFIITFISLIIVKKDTNYYLYNELNTNFSLFNIDKNIKCDDICIEYRGFPFTMRLSPAIHEHMDVLWYGRETLLNIIFYFFIGLGLLGFNYYFEIFLFKILKFNK